MATTNEEECTEDQKRDLHNVALKNVSLKAVDRACSGEACHWRRRLSLCSSPERIVTVNQED